MKIKNVFLASLLTKIGVEVKAELVIDDANGTALTFPDISDISEITEGVAISAPDGTYVIPNDDAAMTVVVVGGVVSSVSTEVAEATVEAEASTELEAEVQTVLEAITDEVVALKAANVKLVAELKDLKASLKHDIEKPVAAAATTKKQPQFKLVD